MDLKPILIFIASFLTIIIGIFILRKNYKSPCNISYFFLCLFGGSWGIVKAFQYSVTDIDLHDIIITRLIYFFGILAPLAYLIFSYYFPYKIRTYSKLIIYIIFIIPAFLILLVFFNVLKMWDVAIINQIIQLNIRFYEFLIFALYFFIYIFVSIVILLEKFNKVEGVYKDQIKYIIFATFITFMILGLVNVVFLLFNNFKYDWLGPIFMLINFFIIGYYLFYKVKRV